MQMRKRMSLAVLLLVVPVLFASSPASGQQKAWYRWEAQLSTSRGYHLNGGNPYRDLTIATTFTPISCVGSPWCGSFTGYGFWDGDTTFRIRSAFPVGNWKWEVSCRGMSNGLDCSTDPALNTYVNGTRTTTWGTVNVTASSAAPELLKRGFIRMEPKGRYLTYGDGVAKFFWQADTTWKAVITDTASNTTWNTFLEDRKQRNFTVILMAPSSSADNPTVATGTLFEDIGTSCLGNAWPKSCSRWRPAYWRTLDEKIRIANEEKGLLVVLIGVMDPQGNPSSGPKYPRPEDATVFARNLVARLSGNHVIFSPSFDDRLADTGALTDAVGTTLRQASQRHLVTAHLAGASPISEYQTVANKEWHCFHIFQSGHALTPSNACPGGPAEPYDCAVSRARTLPEALYDHLVPLTMALATCPGIPVPQPNPVAKPNVNGEGAYDSTYSMAGITTQAIDTPAGVRHTGYYSTLSGSFGFSLGVKGIYDWTNVSGTTLNSDGSKHMKTLGDQFRQQPWQALQKRSPLVKNQPAREDQKIVMAVTNDNTFAMLYLPNNPQAWIDASSLLGFDCKTSTWTKEWIDPRSGFTVEAPVCDNPTQIIPWHVLKRPLCSDGLNGETGSCDWVVRLKKTSSPGLLAEANSAPVGAAPEVFPRMRDDGRGWEVMARVSGTAQDVPVSGSPSPLDSRQAAQATVNSQTHRWLGFGRLAGNRPRWRP